jgi:predicted metalloendopeptidase
VYKHIAAVFCAATMTGTALAQSPRPAPTSGVETQFIEPSIRAADDFYRYANDKWIATAVIPADKPSWSPPYMLHQDAQEKLRSIIEEAAASQATPTGGEARKVGDLYRSFMDEARIEALGMKPLAPEFEAIAALKHKSGIPALLARFKQIGIATPVDLDFDQDRRNSTAYVAYLSQAGLGLPDRDYYLDNDDPKQVAIRKKYVEHVERMMAMAGSKTPKQDAADIVAFETALAQINWTRVESRDPVKTYHKIATRDLPAYAPGFDWNAYLAAAGVSGKVSDVVLYQDTYLKAFAELYAKTPLPVWQTYLKWRVLREYGRFLDKAIVDERFAFFGTTLYGIPQIRPRWERGVQFVDDAIGEALGRVYVAKYFPPESKAKMEKLVANLLLAYKQSIDGLEWMGPETKKEAHAKLAKIANKIGYPAKWRDYSALVIKPDDLVGNMRRASRFEYDRQLAKLGKPIDRDEWLLTPQTVNAYYNATMNEIVFPAAYLQPPNFNPAADDAANYGAIGRTIGHEISHAFDDSGSQYDGDGNLREWWTPEDHKRFAEKTKALVAQFDAYSPVPGYFVNGKLTLGENIADLSGLAIAYKAYKLSLGGKEAPVIDGLTGDQRFFLNYAQAHREKTRDEIQVVIIKTDPHSPDKFRVNGPVSNLDAFYETFNVKPGDKLYRAPQERVSIW